MVEKSGRIRRPAYGGLLPRVEQDCNGHHGTAGAAAGEQGPAERACRYVGLQRSRQRSHRRRDRTIVSGSCFARRIPAAVAAGEPGGHEREGRLGFRQEHNAPAAASPGEAAWITMGGVWADQPGYLAKVSSRLRLARRWLQI